MLHPKNLQSEKPAPRGQQKFFTKGHHINGIDFKPQKNRNQKKPHRKRGRQQGKNQQTSGRNRRPRIPNPVFRNIQPLQKNPAIPEKNKLITLFLQTGNQLQGMLLLASELRTVRPPCNCNFHQYHFSVK
ncbi:MAG: hypothetical protein ACD_65C00322G0001 [uncultured bacterium]|nr:MAG: hypothetical protein ACD_65C00322G0001 [uncultured bacterium]